MSAVSRRAVGAGRRQRAREKWRSACIPLGATFLVGGDDNKEVNFNVYSAGTNLTYYVNQARRRRRRTDCQLWARAGRVLQQGRGSARPDAERLELFRERRVLSGRHRRTTPAVYVTGGVGAVSLHSRTPTGQFGYDPNTMGFETFIAENVGGGLKIFRGADAPDWGFRIDYRYVIVNSNSDAPAFFAKAKTRGGHRVAFGVLFTWKR